MTEFTYIKGRNSVVEALKGGRAVKEIIFTSGVKGTSINDIKNRAKKQDISCRFVDDNKMFSMVGEYHQGVVAVVEEYDYLDGEELIKRALASPLKLIVALDCVQDPNNLGAIIRTSECVGLSGIVITRRRSAQITPAVEKSSAGALAYIPVARVVNLNSFILNVKKYGFWVAGLSPHSKTDYFDADLTVPLCLVLGSEGKGLRPLVEENCDFTIKIPMAGKIPSLNVSVSCGIVLYESLRQRREKKA